MIELLVAMTIVSMVLLIIFGGFYLGVNSWQKGDKRIDRQQRLRMIFEQFEQDLRSAFSMHLRCDNEGLSSQNALSLKAESNKITFITTTQGLSDSESKSSLRMVSYYVNGADEEQNGFVMEEFSNYLNFFEPGDQESSVYQLDPDVMDISFQYYLMYQDPDKAAKLKDGNQPSDEDIEPPVGDWVSEWNPCEDAAEEKDSENNIDQPEYKWISAVEVKMTIRGENEDEADIELPPRVIPILTGYEINMRQTGDK